MSQTATKTLRTLISAATSNSAGGTTTSTVWDLRTAFGGILTIKITNGATGPTELAVARVQISGDNSNWKTHLTFVGPNGNNAVGEYSPPIHDGIMYLRVVVDSNTGQAVTCEAFGQEFTSVG